MKIYLIRHGQTTGDLEDRYGGDYEDHLTEEGRKQAQELAEKLANKKIEAVFYSPRIRAQETASIIREKLNCPFEMVGDLRERNAYGILTGMIKAEAKAKHPDHVELLKNPRNTIKGAEKYEDFKERILREIDRLAHSDYHIIALITHGGPIHCFSHEVIGQELSKLGDCAIIEIEYKTGKYNLISMDGASL